MNPNSPEAHPYSIHHSDAPPAEHAEDQYDGDLLWDIVRYRTDRMKGPATDSTIPSRLLDPPRGDGKTLRLFRRFACCRRAQLLISAPRRNAIEVTVTDLAPAGAGAKLNARVRVEKHAPAQLVFVGTSLDWYESLRFSCRVAWSHNGSVGLMFVGAPEIETLPHESSLGLPIAELVL